MAPEGDERIGDVSNVVFSNGWVARDDGEVLIYYGVSDTRTRLTTQVNSTAAFNRASRVHGMPTASPRNRLPRAMSASPVSTGALDDPLAYRLPGEDPYGFLFTQAIPKAAMTSPEEVATALADLAERPAVPLRVPVGAVAEKILAARDAAPYDRPFARA